ncbi:multidrug efflux SMR transporter [Paenibacillus rhizovicinus]|uniref:Multidrug efflux SMR transporter n=1 Tax=Paenibacillus rhizovicinus TaxID=2704463 RepID=A0A6C0NYZ1_9BACL|nr:multidrug efflux SMR transporter [Paenibacillus rhizovicinus]QHW31438.1 multidrug efflux SMR transporter [Paenibacillus rhizovicinus]
MGWFLLGCAIVLELSGTVSMKLSNGFARLTPSILMFVFYGGSFTMLNYALHYLQISVAYAVWSGIGIVLITFAGLSIFGEKLQPASYLWIGVIVIGVIGLNISSKGH